MASFCSTRPVVVYAKKILTKVEYNDINFTNRNEKLNTFIIDRVSIYFYFSGFHWG